MKREILFICFLMLFAGCRTPQKITSQATETIKTNEAITSETSFLVDTTKKTNTEITYYKIEFYPPQPDAKLIPDSILPTNESIQGVKTNNRAIKSIESYTVKIEDEESGVTESKENRQEEIMRDINRQEEINEQPAPDAYRWRYILGIVIILAALLVYFKKLITKS
jgi:hypothetical protein